MNIQNLDNFFTAGAHAIKKIKIFRSCSKFKTIPQLFSRPTIEIVSVVVMWSQLMPVLGQLRLPPENFTWGPLYPQAKWKVRWFYTE